MLPLFLAAPLVGCVVEDPPGPATVVVTVHPWPADAPRPAQLLGDAAAYDLPTGATDPWLRAAELFSAGDLDPLARDEGRLPGSATTLAEVLTAEGFETGAFVSGERFAEGSGIFQGFLHLDEDWLRAHSGLEPGAGAAALAAAQFVRLKIPRPLEDTGFAWLHLELDGEPPTLASLESALQDLRDGLAADPAAVVALVDLTGASGAVAIGVSGEPASNEERTAEALDPGAFTATLRAAMRAADAEEE